MSSLIANPQLININLIKSGKKREAFSLLLMLNFSAGEPLRIQQVAPARPLPQTLGDEFAEGNLP